MISLSILVAKGVCKAYLVCEGLLCFTRKVVVAKMNLNSILQADIPQERRFLNLVAAADLVDRLAINADVKVGASTLRIVYLHRMAAAN